jgi:uncharacterized damage-inducible protein DinB
MEPPASFVLASAPGFAPTVGRLVAMLTYTRWTTLRAVEGLTVAQLDHLHDERSNSIGALLAHIAAVEVSHQRLTFDGRSAVPDHAEELKIAEALGDEARRALRGRALTHYTELLRAVRDFTVTELAARTDAWLEEPAPFALIGGRPANNHFKWFHVAEDELNHRGQIRWLRQRLPAPPLAER